MKCCVPGCRSYTDKRFSSESESSISFHKFPTEVDIRSKWIEAINRIGWSPTKYSSICSLHFSENDFMTTKKGYKKVRYGAFPYIGLDSISAENKFADYPDPINIKQEFKFFNDTPRNECLKKEISKLKLHKKKYKKQIKTLQTSLRRLKKKQEPGTPLQSVRPLVNIKSLINELQDKNLISYEEADILSSIEIKVAELVRRLEPKVKKAAAEAELSPALRAFALTLHYYSSKAYIYVRKTFRTLLPHPRLLHKWCTRDNFEPGFTAEAFKILRQKCKLNDNKRHMCSLMMNEMDIKEHVEWDGSMFHGFVDVGVNKVQNDNSEEARKAVVMLLVSLTEQWKIPVGFFLTRHMTGEQRASLIQKCLYLCDDVGVDVMSLTVDGCAANIAMVKKLGCVLEPPKLRTTFRHPCANHGIAVFLDPCHMLKLVRYALQAKQVLIDYQGNKILWSYLVELKRIHNEQEYHIAHIVTDEGIHFNKHIVKVNLASQFFSNSLADTLETYKESKMNFKDASATVTFIRILNNLFDIFNSRNLRQCEFKKPLCEQNMLVTKQFLEFAEHYLLHLFSADENVPLIQTNRKTGFIGLLVCTHSTLCLYTRLVENQKKLKYLAFHKLSLDHLELNFENIRSLSNNYPTSRQFKTAYKETLVNTELKNSTVNCLPLEDIYLINASSVTRINKSSERQRMIEEESQSENNYDDLDISDDLLNTYDAHINTTFKDKLRRQLIRYIAGHVVKYLLRSVRCEFCISALYTETYFDDHKVIKLKSKGGLVYPEKDVIKICLYTEISIKMLESSSYNSTSLQKHNIVTHTLKSLIGQNCFAASNNHMYDQEPLNNHIVLLMKSICEKYIDFRLYRFGRSMDVRPIQRQIML